MAGKVRASKFRHIFGKPEKKEHGYDDIRLTKSSWEGSTYCAVNPKFMAVIQASTGGSFLVMPLSKVGRVERDHPSVCGHSGEVLDIKWHRFNDNVIASASDDTTVKLWQIPEHGILTPLTEPIVTLRAHTRKVGIVEWHPTADGILASAGGDFKICLWNAGTEELLAETVLPNYVVSMAFNYNGSLLATANKDKIVRVLDARTLDISNEFSAHVGAKPQQVCFMKSGTLLTTGFSRMSERELALWKLGDDGNAENLNLTEIDNSNAVLYISYDQENNVVYLAGKGDTQIRFFEVTDEPDYVHFLNVFQSTTPMRGFGFMPKRGCNVNLNEVARFYKMHANGGLVEPISMTVPRKSDLFQDDLYPDTASDQPALFAEDWFDDGKNADPILMSMRDLFTNKTAVKTKVRSNILNRGGGKTAAAAPKAAQPEAKEPAPVKTQARAEPRAEKSSASSVLSNGAGNEEVKELRKEVESLRSLVEKLEKRLEVVEKMALVDDDAV